MEVTESSSGRCRVGDRTVVFDLFYKALCTKVKRRQNLTVDRALQTACRSMHSDRRCSSNPIKWRREHTCQVIYAADVERQSRCTRIVRAGTAAPILHNTVSPMLVALAIRVKTTPMLQPRCIRSIVDHSKYI